MHSGISNMVRTTQEHNQPSNELFIILYIYIYYVCVYIILTLARVYYVISNTCNSYAYSREYIRYA